MLGMVSVGEKVTFECLDNMPPAGSKARAMFENDLNRYPVGDSLASHAMDAYLLMQYANLSGFDHVRALVTLIRAPRPGSTALATVTRGALEAFARSWYLLDATDEADLIHRTLSTLYSDLRYPARHGEVIMTRDGDPADPTERRAFYSAELSRLGLPPPRAMDLSQAVGQMLDAEFNDDGGKLRYSSLSSVAHAHRLGVNTFIVTDETGGVAGLVPPHAAVVEFAVELMAAMSTTMDALVLLFGNNSRQVELVKQATHRAAQSLSKMV